jgi:hypothetical protein
MNIHVTHTLQYSQQSQYYRKMCYNLPSEPSLPLLIAHPLKELRCGK